MSQIEVEVLKGQKSSVDRGVKQVGRARREVLEVLDGLSTADATQRDTSIQSLKGKTMLLKTQLTDANELLTKFEQKAASLDIMDYETEQESWGDLVYEAQSTLAEASAILEEVKASTGVSQGVGVPNNGDGVSGSTTSVVSGDNLLSGQFSRMLTILEQQHNANQTNGHRSGTGIQTAQYTRLPKLDVKKFEGDMLKWKPFWDRFEAAVDSNDRLAPVDKLNYLFDMLAKEPLKLIESLPLTSENYETAKVLLKSKYGDPRMIIALLYRKLNDMKPINNDTTSLRSFVAEIDCLLGSLEAMGQDTSDDNLVTVIMSKLNATVVIELERDKPVSDPWTVQLVRSKLADYLTRVERAAKISAISKHGGQGSGSFDFTSDGLFSGDGFPFGRKKKPGGKKPPFGGKFRGPNSGGGPKEGPHCAYCEGAHYTDECTKYPTADERFKRLNGRCIICLSSSHKKAECRSRRLCFHCKKEGNHHSSLCFKKFGKGAPQMSNFADTGEKGGNYSGDLSDSGSTLLASGEGVAMQTAQVPIKTETSRSEAFDVVRAVFDPGASKTFCTTSLAKRLGLRLAPGPVLPVYRFGSNEPIMIKSKLTQLRVRKNDKSLFKMNVYVIPRITGQLVRMPVKSDNLLKLQSKLKLADNVATKFESTTVEFLIGNDYYLDLIVGDKIRVEPGLWLLGSEFGYILSGRSALNDQSFFAFSMCGFTPGVLDGLNELSAQPTKSKVEFLKPQSEDYWSLETIGINEEPGQKSDDLAIQSFRDTVKFENGRYSVGLPWNEKAEEIRDDYALSRGRLSSLMKRLKGDEQLFEQYNSVIQGQLDKGVIEKVDQPGSLEGVHYIPHHGVVDPERETTKLRVVYDGSAKARKESTSLNECLYRGPIILEDLVGLLLRFRTHPIALIADMEKAFLQIGINTTDRDMLRFLWLADPKRKELNNNVQEYRFCRVVFGLNCSPALLAQTVKYHLERSGSESARKVLKDLYVDNVITGVESVEEGQEFYKETKAMFNGARINLRSWASNSKQLTNSIPAEDRLKNSTGIKVMGYVWDSDKDTLAVGESKRLAVVAKSKRQLLSQLASVFDPLGLFTPVTLQAKLLLQNVAKSNAKWDELFTETVSKDSDNERLCMQKISRFKVPRQIEVRGRCSLVAFSDASSSSFATAVYLRCETETEIQVNLVMSKVRLNPLQKLTIPRMELMGVLIGTRALNFVARHLEIPIKSLVLFTDSSCVLGWLTNQTKQDLFVRNRVREIAKSKWITHRYVQTDQNPADWATRGKAVRELDRFWWNGPAWLEKKRSDWPTWNFKEVKAQESEQKVKPIHEVSLAAAAVANTECPFDIDVNRFSSHRNLMRVTAWCVRFVKKLRREKVHSKYITAAELKHVQDMWEKSLQAQFYGSVLERANKKDIVRFGNLWVFKHDDKFLRCKTRLGNADISWEQKYPKLLPGDQQYTKLWITRIHEDNRHASIPHTLLLLRQAYWIPKGRQVVMRALKGCVKCKKAIGRPFTLPPIPELPVYRVRPQPPFTSTGVDYFGPLKVKGRNETEKAWVALFTCMTTRAVHLELVSDASADEFLMAFRRFVSRRGRPKIMVSDNGSQFRSTAAALTKLWSETLNSSEVMNFSANQGITWKFIVEYAPYMGGVYERLVGVVKTSLRKTIGQALLTHRQLEAVLFECESVVNTRPLTYVASDNDGGVLLTPAHFLSLNPSIAVPPITEDTEEGDYVLPTPTTDGLIYAWRKGDKLVNEFWRLWVKEYLMVLASRARYQHAHNQGAGSKPTIGQVVILKNLGLPRGTWRLAKITEVHESADRFIRSVSVQLPSGRVLRRPVNLVVPLEFSNQTVEPETDHNQRLTEENDERSETASPEL